MDILLKIGSATKMFCHQVNITFRNQLNREGQDLQDEVKLAEMRSPRTHPVLLAKQMLLFSLTLLHLPPHEHISGLSEHYPVIMERLADAAINLVTTCEELLGTMESLECILLEEFYHLDNGNIRRAWIAFRRAMAAAQLMGIHRHRPSISPVNIILTRNSCGSGSSTWTVFFPCCSVFPKGTLMRACGPIQHWQTAHQVNV